MTARVAGLEPTAGRHRAARHKRIVGGAVALCL
jgi:hypothetical protein